MMPTIRVLGAMGHDLDGRELAIERADVQSKLGIPRRFHGAKFGDFPAIEELLEGFFRGARKEWALFITGLPGVGKTRMGMAFVRRCFVAGLYCELWHVPTLCEHVASFRAEAAETRDVVSRAGGLVILDDAWAEAPEPRHIRALSEIVFARHEQERRTLVLTNLSLEAVSAFSERTASRLAEGVVLEVEGDDRRRRPGVGPT